MTIKIPTKPHSSVGLITTAVDDNYLHMNLKSWDPYGVIYGGASQAMWELIMYLSHTHGVDVKDEKTIEADEITALKIYPALLLSYLQNLRSQKNIIDKCPIFQINVSTSDNIFTQDEWQHELMMGTYGNFPSVPGFEDFVTRINPVWKVSEEYPLLNYPASYYLQWMPNKTTAELRALRVLLGTYAESYTTALNKCKIKHTTFNAEKFVSREVPQFSRFQYDNKDWLYWNGTGGYISIQNEANNAQVLMTARRYAAGEIMDVSTANWLSARDKFYIIPSDGEPSDLVAVTQMFFPYHANNLMGCAYPNDGGGINDDALLAAGVATAKLARSDPSSTNDTVAQACDRDQTGRLFCCFPSIFGGQTQAAGTLVKLTEEAGQTTPISDTILAGGLRLVDYDTAVWDNTNGLVLQSFFQDLLGKSMGSVSKFIPKSNRDRKIPSVK